MYVKSFTAISNTIKAEAGRCRCQGASRLLGSVRGLTQPDVMVI